MTTLLPLPSARFRGRLGILGASFGVLFDRWFTLALILLVVAIGALLAVAAVAVPAIAAGALVAPGAPGADGSVPIPSGIGPDMQALASGLAVVLGLLAIPFGLIWFSAGVGAVIAVLVGGLTGRRHRTGSALGIGLQRALPMFGSLIVVQVIRLVAGLPLYFAALAAGLFYVLGIRQGNPQLQLLAIPFAVMIPFIVIALIHVQLRLSFAPFAAVAEDGGPIGAVEQSWNLTRGHTWRLFWYTLVIVVAMAALAGLVQLVVAASGWTPETANLAIADVGVRIAESLSLQPEAGFMVAAAIAMLVNAIGITVVFGLMLWVTSVWAALYVDIRAQEQAEDAALPATGMDAIAMDASGAPSTLPVPVGAERPPDAEEVANMRAIDQAWSQADRRDPRLTSDASSAPDSSDPPDASGPAAGMETVEPPWASLPIASDDADAAAFPPPDADLEVSDGGYDTGENADAVEMVELAPWHAAEPPFGASDAGDAEADAGAPMADWTPGTLESEEGAPDEDPTGTEVAAPVEPFPNPPWMNLPADNDPRPADGGQ